MFFIHNLSRIAYGIQKHGLGDFHPCSIGHGISCNSICLDLLYESVPMQSVIIVDLSVAKMCHGRHGFVIGGLFVLAAVRPECGIQLDAVGGYPNVKY